jgi:hypothetical protein
MNIPLLDPMAGLTVKPLSAILNRNSQYASQFSEIFPCPMTRFLFDQFAKNYLKELLSPIGEVKTSDEVRAEVRQIDVRFTPTATSVSSSWIQELGLSENWVENPVLIGRLYFSNFVALARYLVPNMLA